MLTLAVLAITMCPAGSGAQTISEWIDANCDDCAERMATQTGAYILERGEEALIGRAWLGQNATRSIDIQYFIWSTDNIGILAAQQLLAAADRGVRVRVLVDDLLIDAENKTLLLLSAHPNAEIRIYNPNLAVGVSTWQKVKNVFTDFRAINQRMHDKTAIFDNLAGITGGRNMADEYFDYDHEYNFRDRDILLVGAAVQEMTDNFEEFWTSEFAVPVEKILADELGEISAADVAQRAAELHAYAEDPRNFAPQVRAAIDATGDLVASIMEALVWDQISFISDIPGKNPGHEGLGGSGESTRQLIAALEDAKESVLIQTPYLVMPEGGIEFFKRLVDRGVRIRISTNSLASTDNIQAFSGYASQREELLLAGIEIYEYKAYPAIRKTLAIRHPAILKNDTVFALHAKSLVIDGEVIYIGTFNLDPRSANLNTEVGVLVTNEELGRQLTDSIEGDMRPENSWLTTLEFNPDDEVGFGKRMRVNFNRLLPIEPVL
ncbi:MAG: phospholipase D family protein [Woeseiaceae bacterium]